jgi:hypothetical protein
MMLYSRLLFVLLVFQGVVWSGERPSPPPVTPGDLLKKLKGECDNPKISNESYWTSYASETEMKRTDCINQLKSTGQRAVPLIRQEITTAKGEYKQMLTIALAAFGDNTAIWQTGRLMLKAEKPAVRFCAARQLQKLDDKRLIGPFKQALSDPFKRMSGVCVNPGMIYPVRVIASDALVGLGMTPDEVRKIGTWWE